MITKRRRREKLNRYTLFLCFVLIVVWVLILALMMINQKRFSMQVQKPLTAEAGITSTLSADDLNANISGVTLDEIVNRPLFLISRQPFVEDESGALGEDGEGLATPDEVVEPITATLSSIIMLDDLKVIFLDDQSGSIRLEEGMRYKGWLVKEVRPEAVTLENNQGEENVLQLRKFSIAPPTKIIELGP